MVSRSPLLKTTSLVALLALWLSSCAPRSSGDDDDGGPRTGRIAGRVIRPDGSPEPDAPVFVATRSSTAAELSILRTTTAAFDGRYEFTNLAAGSYVLGASPDAMSAREHYLPPSLQLASSLFPGVPRTEPGQPVRVFEGMATEGVDIWLGPAPPRYSVSGRVFWPDAMAVEHVTIEYGAGDAVRSGIWTVGDPGGLFTIDGVSAGTLVMLARADSGEMHLRGMAATHVALGSVEDVRLTLGRPGAVEGRVVPASDLRNVSLRVRLAQRLLPTSPLFPLDEAAVGVDGRFLVSEALGEYTVEVTGLPDGWRVARVSQGARHLRDRRVVVTNGESVSGIEVFVGK
jgi:hypothetical protein